MEFWGIEVKPGESIKSVPGEDRYLHISQACLGVTKKDKASENVPIFVKFNDQKLVIGTLSGERCPQISYDLVFEKEFELSHSSKSTSVFFSGYRAVADEDSEYPYGFSGDSSDEDEDIELAPKVNGKLELEPVKVGKPVSGKGEASTAKPKVKADKTKPEDSDDDDDDEDDDEDSDDDGSASDDEDMLDEDDSDEDDEEETPQKVESGKKRAADSASKTPVPEKKAKLISPAGSQKKGGDGKKGGHTATPHPAKQVGKTPANNDKSKQQSPKSGGSSVTCKSCSKSFNSDHALQAHSKAKHETAK